MSDGIDEILELTSGLRVFRSEDAPSAVSKRCEFTAAEEYIDQLALPVALEPYRPNLVDLVERVIHSCARNFAEGARRGIEQTANLICDPDFYKGRAKRNHTRRERLRESLERQEADHRERQQCPTQEQIQELLRNLDIEIKRYELGLQRMQDRREQLKKMKAKNIRLTPCEFPKPPR